VAEQINSQNDVVSKHGVFVKTLTINLPQFLHFRCQH